MSRHPSVDDKFMIKGKNDSLWPCIITGIFIGWDSDGNKIRVRYEVILAGESKSISVQDWDALEKEWVGLIG